MIVVFGEGVGDCLDLNISSVELPELELSVPTLPKLVLAPAVAAGVTVGVMICLGGLVRGAWVAWTAGAEVCSAGALLPGPKKK